MAFLSSASLRRLCRGSIFAQLIRHSSCSSSIHPLLIVNTIVINLKWCKGIPIRWTEKGNEPGGVNLAYIVTPATISETTKLLFSRPLRQTFVWLLHIQIWTSSCKIYCTLSLCTITFIQVVVLQVFFHLFRLFSQAKSVIGFRNMMISFLVLFFSPRYGIPKIKIAKHFSFAFKISRKSKFNSNWSDNIFYQLNQFHLLC